MKNKLTALILSIIMVMVFVPTISIIGETDPSKDDNFDGPKKTTVTTTTSTATSTTGKTDLDVKVPAATNLKYAVTSVSSIVLTWDKVEGATSYQIYKSEGKNVIKVYKTVPNNSLAEAGLKRGTDYKYQVIAVKKVDNKNYYSEYSNTVSFTTFANKISKVAKKVTKNSATLKISVVGGADKYEVKYSTNKKMKKAKKVTAKKANVKIKKLKKNTKYYVTVRAYKTVNGKKALTKVKKLNIKTKK